MDQDAGKGYRQKRHLDVVKFRVLSRLRIVQSATDLG